jgi:tRNA G18 (ribose-2'-O)-methylase SpoU
VVLDNIRSAYNVGSIFRTSDAAGVTHLYLCGMTPYPPNPKLEKTALGAIPHVSWSHHVETLPVVRALREAGIPVWACETGPGSRDYLERPFPAPVALVFGHEVAGIGPDVLAETQCRIAVPMAGYKRTLNVATAFGVILFEALRQYRERGVWSPPARPPGDPDHA